MSEPLYFRYWGKAAGADAAGEPFHLLACHALDVAAVGQILLERHPLLLARLAALMQLPKQDTRLLCTLLLGLHDLGKFARSFQLLRADLRAVLWPDEAMTGQAYSVRHDTLGKIIWRDRRMGVRRKLFPHADEILDDFLQDLLPCWLDPVFGHHGWPPQAAGPARPHFQPRDAEAALAFVRDWLSLTGIDISRLAAGMQEPMLSDRRRQASWLLAGLAVLCDWLGSDQNLFTYRSTPLPLATYWSETALPTACQAVEQAGIIPQTPHSHLAPAALFPYLEQASPLQRQCARVALGDGPRLFILEEATGAGKTEAALILTHRLMAAGRARGLYIGLPTMATANAMYERMGPFYRRLYRDTAHPSLILSHSARHLSARFRQSLLNGQQEEQATPGQETVSAQCNRWLADSRKKALLADVGIGTLDQALLAVVAVRHQSLRLFGLLGKVLILDEVHAYDAYTGRLLHNLLRFHAALGGDAILLSATLTRNQRQALIDAFCAGAGTPGSNLAESTAYPLLTHAGSPSGPEEYPLATRATVRRRVAVDFLHDESGILRVIQEATSQGQCVCWIRNTVQDARDAWERLREAIWLDPGQLHLFHSRYTLGDRLAIEQETLGRFGKTSAAEARRGQVLIATQVVEQSLDIDFDRMISDLAPVDLLIQRAGRLQRHHRDPEGNPLPAGSADRRGTPELLVHAPPFSEHPDQKWYKEKFPRADHVYSHTVILWRTQRILQAQGGWRMPEDAREMLETVYDPEGEIPPGLSDNDLEAEGNRFSERDLAGDAALSLNACYGNNGHWDEEAHLQTRLGEATRPLYLARWDGVRLTPWFEEGRYHWDLSSVSIPHHRLSRVADPEDPALQTALQALRETEKLFDEESLVMPLQAVDGRWTGQGMDDRDRRVEMQYDPKIGLEFLFQAGVSR